jgi:hypothetical protein
LHGRYADAVIVVIDQGNRPTGVAIARAAVAAGGAVELVARVLDDPAGDRWLHGLTEAGIGHVATLRQPAGAIPSPLDAADLELALRYLSDARTIVVVELDDARSLAAAVDAAGWSQGALVVIIPAGGTPPNGLPSAAIVLEAPSSDPEGAFAALVGTLAAGLDRGLDPAAAFAESMAATPAWTPVGDEA